MKATAQNRRPRVGDKAWFVEWCEELVIVDGECDHDQCVMNERKFATKDEALAFAKEVWPKTTNAYGVVNYWPAKFTPYDEDDAAMYPTVGFWEPAGDREEIYDGE